MLVPSVSSSHPRVSTITHELLLMFPNAAMLNKFYQIRIEPIPSQKTQKGEEMLRVISQRSRRNAKRRWRAQREEGRGACGAN